MNTNLEQFKGADTIAAPEKLEKEKEKIQKIYLIIPPMKSAIRGVSLGLISIKNFLDNKYPQEPERVKIVDFGKVEQEEIDYLIQTIKPEDLVGVTVTTATYQSTLNLIRKIKEKVDCKIIIGGAHPKSERSDIILKNNPEVDYLALGDGERTLYYLLENPNEPEKVPGLVYRRGDEIIRNPVENLTDEELDVPIIFEESWFISPMGKLEEKNKQGETIPYVSARGCPRRCPFCAVEKKLRSKKVDTILTDIKYLLKKGFKRIDFEDNFFAIDDEKIRELCNRIIDENLNFEWTCQTRVELAKKESIIELMSKSGCKEIFLGIENLSVKGLPKIKDLAQLSPELYIEHTKQIVDLCLKYNISPMIMLQMGIPEEDEEVRKQNLDELKKIGLIAKDKYNKKLNVFLMVTVLYPGTPLFRSLQKKYQLPDDIFEFWTKWEYEHREELNLKRFPHGIGGIPISLVDIESLSRKEIIIKDNTEIEKYHKEISGVDGISTPDISSLVV